MTRFRSVAIVAGLTALALSACGGSAAANVEGSIHWWSSTPIPTPSPAGATGTPSAQPSATAAAAGTAQSSGLGTPAESVSATANLTFDPNATTAKVGDVIQWTNTGSVPHNVTFADPTLTSGTLSQGDTWQVKFSAAGTYTYHCTFHPGMDGTITVTG